MDKEQLLNVIVCFFSCDLLSNSFQILEFVWHLNTILVADFAATHGCYIIFNIICQHPKNSEKV